MSRIQKFRDAAEEISPRLCPRDQFGLYRRAVPDATGNEIAKFSGFARSVIAALFSEPVTVETREGHTRFVLRFAAPVKAHVLAGYLGTDSRFVLSTAPHLVAGRHFSQPVYTRTVSRSYRPEDYDARVGDVVHLAQIATRNDAHARDRILGASLIMACDLVYLAAEERAALMTGTPVQS